MTFLIIGMILFGIIMISFALFFLIKGIQENREMKREDSIEKEG